MSTVPLIELKDVSMKYPNGNIGISHATVSVFPGDFLGLLGHNGAGKSTLIHLFCGLILPTTGTIETNAEIPLRAPFRNIGWLGQWPIMDWYLTVWDNVFLGARLGGYVRSDAIRVTKEILGLLDMLPLANHLPDELSGGQQQRVQIARALVHDPDLIILDEPTTGLDVSITEKLLNYLHERAQLGAAIMISSHDLGVLQDYCRSVLVLERGKVLTMESMESFVKRFGGNEILEVTFAGSVKRSAVIEGQPVLSDTVSPMRLRIPHSLPIGDVLRDLETVVEVVDITRKRPGLKEAYLAIRHEWGG